MSAPENDAEKAVLTEDVSHNARTLLRLREMLFKGEFQRGERLSELPLSARLGVSRTPIRLALERLAHEGLLEASRSGGFVVREFTIDAVWDAIENGQGTRAESVAREHARLSRRNLEMVLTDRDILSCIPGNSLIKT